METNRPKASPRRARVTFAAATILLSIPLHDVDAAQELPTTFTIRHAGVLSLLGPIQFDVTSTGRKREPAPRQEFLYNGLNQLVYERHGRRVCEYGYNAFGLRNLTVCRTLHRLPPPEFTYSDLSIASSATLTTTGAATFRLDTMRIAVMSQSQNRQVVSDVLPGAEPVLTVRRREGIRRVSGRSLPSEWLALEVRGVDGTYTGGLRVDAEWPLRVGRAVTAPPDVTASPTATLMASPKTVGTVQFDPLFFSVTRTTGEMTVTLAPDCGVLAFDATWTDESAGTVVFTSPSSLAGTSADIRRTERGEFFISEANARVSVRISSKASGTYDIGYGRIAFSATDLTTR